MQPQVEQCLGLFEFGVSARRRRVASPPGDVMDYLRASLGCPSDVDVCRFLDGAGIFDFALFGMRRRWGSRAVPFFAVCPGLSGDQRQASPQWL
eukprot:8581375-Lingulodinium_polyedra.AAC.1